MIPSDLFHDLVDAKVPFKVHTRTHVYLVAAAYKGRLKLSLEDGESLYGAADSVLARLNALIAANHPFHQKTLEVNHWPTTDDGSGANFRIIPDGKLATTKRIPPVITVNSTIVAGESPGRDETFIVQSRVNDGPERTCLMRLPEMNRFFEVGRISYLALPRGAHEKMAARGHFTDEYARLYGNGALLQAERQLDQERDEFRRFITDPEYRAHTTAGSPDGDQSMRSGIIPPAHSGGEVAHRKVLERAEKRHGMPATRYIAYVDALRENGVDDGKFLTFLRDMLGIPYPRTHYFDQFEEELEIRQAMYFFDIGPEEIDLTPQTIRKWKNGLVGLDTEPPAVAEIDNEPEVTPTRPAPLPRNPRTEKTASGIKDKAMPKIYQASELDLVETGSVSALDFVNKVNAELASRGIAGVTEFDFPTNKKKFDRLVDRWKRMQKG